MSQTKAQLIDPVDLSIVTADLADDAVTAAKLASNAVVNASVDASAAIAGTKISPDFGSQNTTTTGITTTSKVTLNSTSPMIEFEESDGNPDYRIISESGELLFQDADGGPATRIKINTDGHIDIAGNLDVGAGIDVTGAITGTAGLSVEGATIFNDSGADVDFRIEGDTDQNLFRVDASTDRIGIGTGTPSNLLHVAGVLECSNIKILGTNSFESSANVLEGKGTKGARLRSALSAADTPSFSSKDDTNTGFFLPGSDVIGFTTGGTERMRIDGQGRLLIGTTTARAVGGESNPVLHIEGSGNTSNSWVNITRFQSTTAGPNLQFAKARSNTPGTYTLVQSGDTLGTISFLGADGTDMANYAARISAQVDGTAASNDMPGRLVFSTTPDGSGASLERMRIDNDGKVGIGNTGPTNVFDGAGLKIEKYQQRNTSYASPDGYYGASLGEVTNAATKVWATVESHYAQANAVSAGLFLKAFHQDAGGSQAGFTIKNLKSGNDLAFSRVTTAASTGNPAVETERLRIRHNGGITFGGETADANALDDYEEGTWTPDIFNAGSTSNWTAKDGNYQKIGNTVTVWFRCDGGTSPRSGASGGHLTITGLPFTLSGMDSNTVLGIGAANFITSGSEDCNISTAGSGNPFVRQGGSNEAEQCNYFSAVFSYLTTQ